MTGAFILLFVFVATVGFMFYIVKKKISQINGESGVPSDFSSIRTAQEFLPFDKIEDGVVDLGGFRYRKIIECTSINYHLKTEMEKEMIEASFSRFLNSFDFPISFYIQTREIDMSSYLQSLKNSIEEVCDEFPGLMEYGNVFFNEMNNLPSLTGNSKQKKKYIIVGYEEAFKMDNLTPDEKRAYSIQELNLRVQILIDNLAGLGINASVLNTGGLLELFYSTYHKDDYSNFEHVLSEEYTSTVTGVYFDRDPETGNLIMFENMNKLTNLSDVKRTENALWNAKNIIKTEILDREGVDIENQELYKAIIDRLDDLVVEMNDYVNNQSKQKTNVVKNNVSNNNGGDDNGIW